MAALNPVVAEAAANAATNAADQALTAIVNAIGDANEIAFEILNLTGDNLYLEDYCFPYYGADVGQTGFANLPSQSGRNFPGSYFHTTASTYVETALDKGGGYNDFSVRAPGLDAVVGMMYYRQDTPTVEEAKYGMMVFFWQRSGANSAAYVSVVGNPAEAYGKQGSVIWDQFWTSYKSKLKPGVQSFNFTVEGRPYKLSYNAATQQMKLNLKDYTS